MSENAFDVIIIGAGMAGASLAHCLAPMARIAILESEPVAGYHATGRSAALFSETYGNEAIRALSRASRSLFEAMPGGLTEHPVLTARGALMVASECEVDLLEAHCEGAHGRFERLTGEEARAIVPVLKPEAVVRALLEPQSRGIDVDAMHRGYLASAKAQGAIVRLEANVTALSRRPGGDWAVEAGGETYLAPSVVNAAGAWATPVAVLAGATPLALQPCRRSAAIIEAPRDVDVTDWPFTINASETFYFGPQSGRLLISGADETPVEPCDVQADDMEIAYAVDRIETATTLTVRRVTHTWAGLRTFAKDRTPIVGFDAQAPGFFWLAGQGGYGIQTAPAIGLLAAHLLTGAPLPAELTGEGVDPRALAPNRPGLI